MEKLISVGLRIGQNEQLKIIPEDVEHGSKALAQKCHKLLEMVDLLKSRLDTTEILLAKLDQQSKEAMIVKLASGISAATRLVR